MNALTTPTYDGSGEVIHPDIYYNASEWNGKKYWLAITPFPSGQSSYENPSILCSDDGNTWTVPVGLTNPIEADPGGDDYNSDPELLVVSDTMYCYYRQTIGGNVTVYYRSSTDGVTWSDKTSVLTGTAIQFVSPTIVHDGSQYVMFYGDQTGGVFTLYRRVSANPTGPWTDPTQCYVPIAAGHNWYHFNCHYEDGALYMFVTSEPVDQTDPLWFAKSVDGGNNWRITADPILEPGTTGTWDAGQLYRSTAVRTASGFDIWYSGKNAGGNWHIGRTSMTFP